MMLPLDVLIIGYDCDDCRQSITVGSLFIITVDVSS